MTPPRAQRLERRWLIAGFAFVVVGTALNIAGFDPVMPLPFLFAALCFGRLFAWSGWRDGYAARMRGEQSEAGGRR
jgi:hypothetical protein